MRIVKSNRREEGLLAKILSVNSILRAIVSLGFFSLIVNILYYTRLPTRKASASHSGNGSDGSSSNNNNNGATFSITNKSSNGNNKTGKGEKTKKTFHGELVGGQLVKKDKKGKEVFHAVTALEVKGLEGDEGEEEKLAQTTTLEEASVGREKILEHLREAGITEFDVATVLKLPTQEQVERLYGKGPVVYGLDKCEYFQQHIPKDDASVGSAGIFNSGTNTLAMYLNANCVMPENKKEKYGGMRWQVPWGKHMLADRKWTNTPKNDRKVNKTNVMPVVAIRDPYTWMRSMCKHPYAAKWHHSEKHCPNLVPNQDDWDLFPYLENSVPVRIKYPGEPAQWDSLAHVWNDWNGQYFHADYPRLMVRFEDLLFNVKEMVDIVCKCAGAVPREEGKFAYIVDDAKFGPGHPGSHSNLISAMIKYGSEKKRYDGMTKEDLRYAYERLDSEMMMAFQYSMPPPP